ncbi:MAG: diguanylate cyclase [Desulfarculaceae bacterium]|nr:diguanylate cyclase [Desulfarculaceae bacterium]MCF8097202.1 diguanylate cyclase [Desulfarculaceae bacterium]MCF8122747.1 diguanylate cyclase [Desulfarculaceae bacterium]
MAQDITLEKLRALGRELERALPDPSPEEVKHLALMAACVATEANLLPPPAPASESDELEEAIDLLNAVVNTNHPSKKMDGFLAQDQSLRVLLDTLWSIRESALALANGDLSVKITGKGFLAGALKTLQSHFKHLTWQTQRVAAGDFTQRVDFMGEFAIAFNAMAERLASSVEALKQKEAELTAKNQELVKEIKNRLRVEKDLRISEERYREMAITDHLTGLYNRRHFYVLAENELKRALRRGHSLALIMLDLDHFKKINDNYGHDVGDKVLAEVGRVLTSQVRSMDICARVGGEEFVLLLPETKSTKAVEVAERLRTAMANTCVADCGKMVNFTASLGVTSLDSERDQREEAPKGLLESIIKQADEALYASKKAGRNRVTAF